MRLAGVLAAGLFIASCVSLDEARPYACAPDGGSDEAQCPKDWRCGLNGFCHARGVEAAYVCNAGSDCEGNYRCGLEHVCHEKGVAADYLCAEDTDCEAGWRCGTSQRCVAPPDDSLAFASFPKALEPFSLQSPLIDAHGATKFAVSPLFDEPDGGPGFFEVQVTWAPDGGFLEFRRSFPVDDGGEGTFDLGEVSLRQLPFAEKDVRDVAFVEKRLYVLRGKSDGGAGTTLDVVYPFANFMEQGPLNPADTPVPLLDGTDAAQLRISNRRDGPIILFEPTSYAVHNPGLFYLTVGQVKQPPSPTFPATSRLFDFAWVTDPVTGVFNTGHFVAATDQGLFIANDFQVDTGNWHALGGTFAPNDRCGLGFLPGYTVEHRRLRPIDRYGFSTELYLAAPDGGSADTLAAFLFAATPAYLNGGPTGAKTYPSVLDDGGCENVPQNLALAFGPCLPCPEGAGKLVDFHAIGALDGGLEMEVRCEADQGPNEGQQLTFRIAQTTSITGASCTSSLLSVEPDTARFVVQTTNSAREGRLETTHGRMWSGFSETYSQPLFFDRPPSVVLLPHAVNDVLLLSRDALAVPVDDAGYVGAVFPGAGNSLEVDGRDDWLITGDGVLQFDTLRPIAAKLVTLLPAGVDTSLLPSGSATVLETSAGGAELVLTLGDSVYGVDVTNQLDGGGYQSEPFQLRAVPLTRTQIRSIAPASPSGSDAGTAFGVLYAHTPSGIFEVRAETKTRWRSSEVVLPDDPVRLFSDGQRARAGLSDGRVFGLPSVLRLAPPLESSLQPASDFVSVCGQPWMLARGGVFRLSQKADGGAEGSWERVEMVPVDRPYLNATPGDLFEHGRLFFRGGKVWVFFADGTAFTAKATCP